MVNEYNTGAHNQGIPESEMHAVVGNFIDSSTTPGPEFNAPEYFNFDIAAVGMGWHHFTEPAYAAKRLSERLKVGGVLLIVDFLPHKGFGDGHGHHHHNHEKINDGEKVDGYGDDKKLEQSVAQTVIHHGFSEEDIKKMFQDAGVGNDFKFVVLGKGVVFESQGKSQSRTVFMARGKKA
jgi:SAM-dependent methyltransferase